MALPRCWCRVTVIGPDGRPVQTGVIEGGNRPDMASVEDLARRALTSLRAGGRLVVHDVDPRLRELLWLAGLPVEVQGQAESREEPLRVEDVEEEGHLGDPTP